MALVPFMSRIIADVGISMGDEGKGRLIAEVIDELRQANGGSNGVGAVMKVNGGANSGHTAGGLKLNLLPAAVINADVRCLAIGSGVVADPRKFKWEITPLEKQGYNILARLLIDERTQVSDLSHRLLDLAWEDYRANILHEEPRGSTGRGISPAFSDEVGQRQIYYCDFKGSKDAFVQKLIQRINRILLTIQHVCQVSPENWNSFFDVLTDAETRANASSLEANIFKKDEFNFHRFIGSSPFTLDNDAIIDAYWEAGLTFKNNIGDVRETILRELNNDQFIIGEFGQSYWLDKRHGFPPNVTASHTFTPEFFQSAGIPLQPLHTIGVCKAYDTKVGTHVFLTQFPDEHPLAVKLKALEFGTSTGRQRMVGWCDTVEKGEALRYGGYQDLMINKLDALSYSGQWQGGELLICTAYRDTEGKLYYQMPRDDAERRLLQPVYVQLPGWEEDISAVRNFEDLPYNAQRYIAVLIKGIVDVAYRDGKRPKILPNLRYIGVGPDPSQIIRDVPQTEKLLALAGS